MREATGELNLTVVVVILVAALAALFGFFVFPMMRQNQVNSADCAGAVCTCINPGCQQEKENGYYDVGQCRKRKKSAGNDNVNINVKCPFKG